MLVSRHVDASAIAELVGMPDAELDTSLRALFPALADATLVEDEITVPAALSLDVLTYPTYELEFPIDWQADPYGNNSWRFYLQNFHWLSGLYSTPEGLDAAGYVIVDWANRVLFRDPPLEWTWHDHGMARRLDRVMGFIDHYAADRDRISRSIAHAAAQIVLTHVYALSSDGCYAGHSNHGMLQDMALLNHLPGLPALVDVDALLEHTDERVRAHVAASVASDGIHVENSPEYHVFYLHLLVAAIDALSSAPGELSTIRDAMLQALVHLLQPNLTLPQFGDTENGTRDWQIAGLLAHAREQGGAVGRAFDELDWVLSGGQSGTRPRDLDRVYEVGGYAAFRERWDALDPSAPIALHFTCGRLSQTHYHRDELGFELYGHGSELIVDTGKYSYDNSDPFTVHQYHAAAHNVLLVDGKSYEPTGIAQIFDHGSDGTVSWVQGTHTHYASLGITSQVRTLAYARPDTVVVVDHLRASGSHRYQQHFHLHPSLSEVSFVDEHIVVATTADRAGPTVVLAPVTPPTAIELVRGEQSERGLQGWYCPGWAQAEPATAVIIHYRSDERDLALPVVVTVAAPDTPPQIPGQLVYAESEGRFTVAWTPSAREISLPLPWPGLARYTRSR